MDTMQRRIDTPAAGANPPSLVTDRFGTPASPDELRLALEAHCAAAAGSAPSGSQGKTQQAVRELRLAAQRLPDRNGDGGPVPVRRVTATEDAADTADTADSPELARTLGLFDIILFGVGGIVGAGIYAIIGEAAATAATSCGSASCWLRSWR